MRINDFRFVDRWEVEARVEEVARLVNDPPAYPTWWPSVWLEVRQVSLGDDRGLGSSFDCRVKGWLPYTLQLRITKVEERIPTGLRVETTGDLTGVGVWTFEERGPLVRVSYEWIVRGDTWFFRYGSSIARPLFASNHTWCMRRGAESMRLELARRHARSAEELGAIPAPPRPAWPARRRRGTSPPPLA